ncbi:hypothetical protein Hanom_Chr05g00394661 [Helianthus anomalus]
MSSDKQQSKPPPVIGKIGYYTVFVTPTAKPSPEPSPVQPPPVHYDKTAASYGSKFGFFWDAIATLQNVHSSLDDYLAHWFGLNQSKYQWALDDYYEHESTVSLRRLTQELKICPPKHKVYNLFVLFYASVPSGLVGYIYVSKGQKTGAFVGCITIRLNFHV